MQSVFLKDSKLSLHTWPLARSNSRNASFTTYDFTQPELAVSTKQACQLHRDPLKNEGLFVPWKCSNSQPPSEIHPIILRTCSPRVPGCARWQCTQRSWSSVGGPPLAPRMMVPQLPPVVSTGGCEHCAQTTQHHRCAAWII